MADPLLWDRDVPWAELPTATGFAKDVPEAIRLLASAPDGEALDAAYWRLDNVVVLQGTVYPAALHVIDPVMRIAATDADQGRRRSCLELILQIAGGWNDPGHERSTGDVAGACRTRLYRWLENLYLLASIDNEDVRELAAEIAGNVETDAPTFERRISWLIEQTGDSESRAFLEGLLARGLRQD